MPGPWRCHWSAWSSDQRWPVALVTSWNHYCTRTLFVASFVALIQTISLVLSQEVKHLNKKKNQSKRILVVVVSWRHNGNGPLFFWFGFLVCVNEWPGNVIRQCNMLNVSEMYLTNYE
jgi:hypothetical protein